MTKGLRTRTEQSAQGGPWPSDFYTRLAGMLRLLYRTSGNVSKALVLTRVLRRLGPARDRFAALHTGIGLPCYVEHACKSKLHEECMNRLISGEDLSSRPLGSRDDPSDAVAYSCKPESRSGKRGFKCADQQEVHIYRIPILVV